MLPHILGTDTNYLIIVVIIVLNIKLAAQYLLSNQTCVGSLSKLKAMEPIPVPVCLWRVGALAQYVCACALRATLALLSPGEGSTLLA